jgi:DNA polymerase I-like protein with 3'-5' exonuclease and polymerase domains
MTYQYIKQPADLLNIIPTIMSERTWGLDCETTGLDPHKDKIILLQIGTIHKQYVLDMRTVPIEPLIPFLTSTSIGKIGHNAKFDYKMIKGNYSIDTENITDTFYAEKILHSGRKYRGFGLGTLASSYLAIEMSKLTRDTFGTGVVPTEDFTAEQLSYAASDVGVLIPLLSAQVAKMTPGQLSVWGLECAALPSFGDMEYHGMPFNSAKWNQNLEDNLEEIKGVEAAMNDLASNIMPSELTLNWSSSEQVLKILQAFKITIKELNRMGVFEERLIDKTDDRTLLKVQNNALVLLLRKHRSLINRINMFGYSYLKSINPITGRLHPEYDQIGTDTGRPANKSKEGSVNTLNIPKESRYRECFIGEPDELIETDDYSNCETRIWAELSGDPKLIRAFQEDVDIHCYVGEILYGKPITKGMPERDHAKTANFGVVYGMGARTFMDKLNAQGHDKSYQQATALLYRLGQEFKTGINFLRDEGLKASKMGYLDNISGRRRYWPLGGSPVNSHNVKDIYKIQKEGGNFPIQSINAEITKRAMIGIRNHIKKYNIRSKFVNQVYDEIITRTHKDDSPEFHKAKVRLMIEAAEHYLKKVPMKVESKIGLHWIK